jgi:hypothetical protein
LWPISSFITVRMPRNSCGLWDGRSIGSCSVMPPADECVTTLRSGTVYDLCDLFSSDTVLYGYCTLRSSRCVFCLSLFCCFVVVCRVVCAGTIACLRHWSHLTLKQDLVSDSESDEIIEHARRCVAAYGSDLRQSSSVSFFVLVEVIEYDRIVRASRTGESSSLSS